MKGYDKSSVQKKSNYSAANSDGSMAIQKKAVSVIQKAAPEEELQQHKSDGTVQKAAATDLEGKPLGVTQKKIYQENPINQTPAQRKENKTGMPDNLKSGIENLSGMNMDHVRVHYNSSQPAQLNALAYAQGSDIHVAPGQEKHLPHEAWHVVQQAQGRVQPTTQIKAGVAVNDNPSLEHEADVMGEQALNTSSLPTNQNRAMLSGNVGQLMNDVSHSKSPSNNVTQVFQLARLSKNVLNVAGEMHLGIDRKLEKDFSAEETGGGYWTEIDYAYKDPVHKEVVYADPRLGRMEYTLLSVLPEFQGLLNVAKSDTGGLGIWLPTTKTASYDNNIFFLYSNSIKNLRHEAFLGHEGRPLRSDNNVYQEVMSKIEESESKTPFSNFITRLHETVTAINSSLDTFRVKFKTPEARKKIGSELRVQVEDITKFLEELTEIVCSKNQTPKENQTKENSSLQRSKHMFKIANIRANDIGVFKIGNNHIEHMKEMKPRYFNLLSMDEFGELYGTWEKKKELEKEKEV